MDLTHGEGALRRVCQKETERNGVHECKRLAGGEWRSGETAAYAEVVLMQSNCMKWMEDALLGQAALLALQF